MQTPNYKELTDQELLDRFYLSKDNQWLGFLLERYTLLLLGVCIKYLRNEEEARDCVQQVFLKAIDELQKYKIHHLKAWLYLVAKNQCLMKLRSQKGKRQVELEDAEYPSAYENTDAGSHVEKDRILTLLESGIGQLNPEQKQCVTLFYLERKSYQEISAITGFTNLQVKSHIQNGKRNLRLFIEKQQRINDKNE